MKQHDIRYIPESIWPEVCSWIFATFEWDSWDLIDDNTLETTEENIALFILRWS